MIRRPPTHNSDWIDAPPSSEEARLPEPDLKHTEIAILVVATILAVVLWQLGMLATSPLRMLLLLCSGFCFNLGGLFLIRRLGKPSHLLIRWGNLTLISLGIWITGGLTSPFIAFYFLYIAVAAIRQGRKGGRWGFVEATVALAFLALLALPFSPHETQTLLVTLAGLVVFAIGMEGIAQQRLDAIHVLSVRNRQLRILHNATSTLTASLYPQQIAETLIAHVAELAGCSRGAIFLLSQEGDRLYLASSQGLEGSLQEAWRSVPVDEHSAPLAITQKRPVFLKDLRKDPLLQNRGEEIQVEGTLLDLPLISGGRAKGLVRFLCPRQSKPTPDLIDLLLMLCQQAALALENARLFQEITDRNRQLQQAFQELRSLDEQRNQFVASIAHDLRAPLTFLQGYVELLLQEELGPLTEEQRNALRVIEEKTHLLDRLTENITTLERLTLAPETLHPVSIVHLARAALQSAQPTAQAAGIALEAELAEDLKPVFGDPVRLAQVLDNLLSNALKYTPAGGKVTVRAKRVANEVHVSVADTGIGIPREAQAHIFDRFYRVQTTNGRPGLGLGLWIVREVIEAHGGRVWMESEPGKGSTFTFALPETGALPSTAPHRPSGPAPQGGSAPDAS